MSLEVIPTLLITANVGSIFEDPSTMLKIWANEFLTSVTNLNPKFIALHCQEVGGKNYERSMQHVEHFVKLLLTSNELKSFDRARIFLDEDYSSAENFTALGNFYFIHESLKNVSIWNFIDKKFIPINGKEIYNGNIENIATKEKAKFPQEFFPECKWSRKGFLRIRFSIGGSIVDFINIHLFHDASNFIAMEQFPSVYCKNRRCALEYTLNRFQTDCYETAPFFLFGDFNFRTDTNGVVKKLTEGLTTTRVQNSKNNDNTKLQYKNDNSQLILTVGKKEFTHLEHDNIFLKADEKSWLRTYDRELESFNKQLYEYPITFPPSYPFEENVKGATNYMKTRCPSWCDRVLLSVMAKDLVSETQPVKYELMGKNVCMGDHKPVYLRLDLVGESGTIKCSHTTAPVCGLYPTTCPCCDDFASVTINVIDLSNDISVSSSVNKNALCEQSSFSVDKNLLHEPYTKEMLSHEPYTPESAESHSPLPSDDSEKNLYVFQKPVDRLIDHQEGENKTGRNIKTPISPTLLKSRLENVLRTEKEDSLNNSFVTKSFVEDKYIPSVIHFEEICKNENTEIKRCRCMSETIRKPQRIRLKSTTSLCSRLDSHHSSSDEDWFEEIFENIEEKNKFLLGRLESNISCSEIPKTRFPISVLPEENIEVNVNSTNSDEIHFKRTNSLNIMEVEDDSKYNPMKESEMKTRTVICCHIL